MKHLSSYVLALSLILFVSTAIADDSEERGKKRKGPPQVALDACAAAVEGDPCSFVGRRDQDIAGTCAVRRDDALVCRPDNRGPRLRRKERQAEESEDSGVVE